MKTLATIILAVVLTACGSGQSDLATVASDTDERVTIQTAEPLREPTTPVVTEPSAPVRATEREPIEPIIYQTTCDVTTYNPCAIEPVAPPVVVACSPSTRGCVAPEGMELCDMWSYNPCAIPAWGFKRLVDEPVISPVHPR